VTDIQGLLAQGMGPRLHWFPADVPVSRLAAVLAGMANTQGGTVLLGIAPRSPQVQGVPDPEGALDLVFQAALLVDPPLVLPMPQVISAPWAARADKSATASAGLRSVAVLQVTVPAGLPNVYSLDGSYLWREGAQTNPLPARRLRQLLMERGVIQFESQVPPGACMDDLDTEKVEAYLQALQLPGDETPEAILLRRGCLRPAQGKDAPAGSDTRQAYMPTYAALLLFGRQPQRWLPGASILAARFFGSTLTDHFIKQEIGGSLSEQLYQAEAFIRDNLRSVVRLVGLAHQETLEYPLEALREVLVNAVAHRDYNLQGDMIHIHLFTDRIEIHSPGGLPGPMTMDNLLEARFSRNPVAMQVLADLGFVERLGYGLNRVVDVMRKNHLRQPVFEELGGSFRVTLFSAITQESNATSAAPAAAPAPPDLSAYQGLDLNPRQELALGFLLQNRRITNRDYQDLCSDVHAETLRRDLVDLVERGVLIKIGDKRATYYILKR
jgi:ATP-dependent DNA helicase RecG